MLFGPPYYKLYSNLGNDFMLYRVIFFFVSSFIDPNSMVLVLIQESHSPIRSKDNADVFPICTYLTLSMHVKMARDYS